jgi:16S rRNA (adenine1518-N6/adenine1519-N6)-dimethyltransferase
VVRGRTPLGQNFLIDRNILDVIERLAELSREDVVLEIGGGPGVLSERLASRSKFLHVVELDRSLEDNLRGVLAPFENVELHMGDATRLDLAAFDPAPDKLVANLPYGVAATVILRTVFELPSIQSWVVMVQKEVGERFAAAAGSDAYGVPSVLAQFECDVKVLRPISRQVFRPVPNVDSVLLGLRRRNGSGGARPTTTEIKLVHDAFRHRRKALAKSLSLSPGAQPGVRELARAALEQMGLPADVRAERLTPLQFADLAARLEA